jgi:hypothetical protein
MNGRIIFLLEEPSMKELLDRLIPRLFPGLERDVHFQCVPHHGKTDLERSIPRKLKGWKEPNVRFVILEDNDNRACESVKQRLTQLANGSGRADTLVRLVCQELESWYIGDLKALSEAFGEDDLDRHAIRKRFAIPDGCQKPSLELERLVPSFQKGSGARLMGNVLGQYENLSHSFNVFVSGLARIAQDLGYSQA